MAYNEVRLHIPDGFNCQTENDIGPHVHCYRCHGVLFSGETVAKFTLRKRMITRKGVPKYFCLDCGKQLADSSVKHGGGDALKPSML